MKESSLYFVVMDRLEDFHKSGQLKTVEDFRGVMEHMHYMIEGAAQDYILYYNREDLEEEYLPMI